MTSALGFKAGVDPFFACFLTYVILRFTSGATPVDCILAPFVRWGQHGSQALLIHVPAHMSASIGEVQGSNPQLSMPHTASMVLCATRPLRLASSRLPSHGRGNIHHKSELFPFWGSVGRVVVKISAYSFLPRHTQWNCTFNPHPNLNKDLNGVWALLPFTLPLNLIDRRTRLDTVAVLVLFHDKFEINTLGNHC